MDREGHRERKTRVSTGGRLHGAAWGTGRGEGLHWVAFVANGNNTHGESFKKMEAEALVNDSGGRGAKRPGEKILLTLCCP